MVICTSLESISNNIVQFKNWSLISCRQLHVYWLHQNVKKKLLIKSLINNDHVLFKLKFSLYQFFSRHNRFKKDVHIATAILHYYTNQKLISINFLLTCTAVHEFFYSHEKNSCIYWIFSFGTNSPIIVCFITVLFFIVFVCQRVLCHLLFLRQLGDINSHCSTTFTRYIFPRGLQMRPVIFISNYTSQLAVSPLPYNK